ncbi:MAG: glycosyltransferase family 2 protein [Magnetococcales bacterium]|nr:glycosyltransferase family 2 protein [Magnetococcales bacterium]
MEDRKKTITVMTPAYNEEEGIRECVVAVREVFEKQLPEYNLEHLFIDNCSTDRTVEILREMAKEDSRIKVIVNSRNFGPNTSGYYGLLQMSGDAVIQVLADLQTPPDRIIDFVRKWEEGYPLVIGVRRSMEEGFLMQRSRQLFYKLIRTISDVEQVRNFCGFSLFDRKMIDILRGIDDHSPYFKGIMMEIGYDRAFIEYDQPLRKHGKSRHSISDLVNLAIFSMSGYSNFPIRLMTIYGFFTFVVSFLVSMVYLVLKLIYWDQFSIGIAPITVGVFFFGSIQILCMGIVGEYLNRAFDHARRRPLILEKERINFDTPAKLPGSKK